MQDVIRVCENRQSTIRRYYSRAAVLKPLVTEMNAHLRVQRCENYRLCSTEMWKKIIWSNESLYAPQVGWVHVWRISNEQEKAWVLHPCSAGIRWLCYDVVDVMLLWFGSLQINAKLWLMSKWSSLSYEVTPSMGLRGVTEWFDEVWKPNYLNPMGDFALAC